MEQTRSHLLYAPIFAQKNDVHLSDARQIYVEFLSVHDLDNLISPSYNEDVSGATLPCGIEILNCLVANATKRKKSRDSTPAFLLLFRFLFHFL